MSYQRHARSILCSVGLVLVLGAVALRAQSQGLVSGPSKIETLFVLDLGDVGQPITTTYRVTIPPGIMTADHTHTGRTSTFVMLEGALTEVRGEVKHEYKTGDVVAVAEGVTHHAENFGTVPAVYIEVSTTTKKK